MEDRYDGTTKALHWATAAFVALLWLIGRLNGFLPKGPLRVDIWSIHVLLGLALAIVVLARIAWRLIGGRRLPPVDDGLAGVLASGVHIALYILLVGVVGLGIYNTFARGFPLFGAWNFPKVGDAGYGRVVNGWHDLFANLIAAAAAAHALAALFHHYVLNDGVLARMLPRLSRPR